MENLALDNIYRSRWEEYHLPGGIVRNSCEVNWRCVEWEKLEKLVTRIRDRTIVIDKQNKPGFIGFCRWRCAGHKWDIQHGLPVFRKTHTWMIGWADGRLCYMTEFDFKTAKELKQQAIPINEVKNSLHPRLKARLRI